MKSQLTIMNSNSCQFCKDVQKNSTDSLVSLISMCDAANFMG